MSFQIVSKNSIINLYNKNNKSGMNNQKQQEDSKQLYQKYNKEYYYQQQQQIWSPKQSNIHPIDPSLQHYKQFFPIYDRPSPENLNLFIDQLKNSDLSYFYNQWKNNRDSILNNIRFMLTNWSIFKIQFSTLLQQFIHIIDAKIRCNSMHQILFPLLSQLIKQIERTLEITADRKKAQKCQSKHSDMLFQKYVQQLWSLSKRQGAFYIKGQNIQSKIPIGEFISQNVAYIGSSVWKQIFFISSCSVRQTQFNNMGQNVQALQQKINRKNFLQKVTNLKSNPQYKLVPALNRICCSKLFFFNFDIYDKNINNCPILTGRKLRKLEQTKDRKQIQQVLLDIIALMNDGGGVILFNTIRNYLEIWPKGQSIIEADQIKYKKIIENQIKNIQPQVKLQEISISFVPVARNPYTISTELNKQQIFYIKGLYIMRITVKPKNPQNFYYLSQQEDNHISSCISNERRKILKGKDLIKYYKTKLQRNIIDQQEQQILSFISRPKNVFHDHQKCLQPQKGLKAIDRSILPTSNDQDIQKYEKQFNYLTLLVANKANHYEIKQKLRNKGTQCQIVVKYAQYKFRAAKNSAALYHNQRFDRLLTQIAYNKQFQFNGRFVLTILVTQYLKLTDRNQSKPYPYDQFVMLMKWLAGEHPKQKLTLWRFTNGQNTQYYLKTQSKISTLYMYYVLNQFDEKSTFKNPPNYQKMSKKDRQNLIKQHYPPIEANRSSRR